MIKSGKCESVAHTSMPARITPRLANTSFLEKTQLAKTVTYDLERQMTGATLLSCSDFGRAIVDNMED